MTRARRKLVCRVAAAALAGVVLTVAVAWAAALWGPTPFFDGAPDWDAHWTVRVPSGWPGAPDAGTDVWRGRIASAIRQAADDPTEKPEVRYEGGKRIESYTALYCIQRRFYGWPTASLEWREFGHESEWWHEHGLRLHIPHWVQRAALPWWNREPLLPLLPRWSGFAVNTAFYGTLAFLLWSAPGFVRRTRRRSRGQCLNCGYELKGMNNCPECGR